MAISNEIQRIQTNISDAYDVVASKGGSIPTTKNTDNLPGSIASIIAGGGAVIEGLKYEPGDILAAGRYSNRVGATTFYAFIRCYFDIDTGAPVLTSYHYDASSLPTTTPLAYNGTSIILIGDNINIQNLTSNARDKNIFDRTISIGNSLILSSISSNNLNDICDWIAGGEPFKELTYVGESFFALATSSLNYTADNWNFDKLETCGTYFMRLTNSTSKAICKDWSADSFRKLKTCGLYFLNSCEFTGISGLYFDTLETLPNYFMYSNNPTNCDLFLDDGFVLSFNENIVLTSSLQYFLVRGMAPTKGFTLEFKGLQTLLVPPANFMTNIDSSTVDLRLKTGSYGVDVVNNIWLTKTWKSITLI
jgi:hypothetical protein